MLRGAHVKEAETNTLTDNVFIGELLACKTGNNCSFVK